MTHETITEDPIWRNVQVEAAYKDFEEARKLAAQRIRGHLLDQSAELKDKSPLRITIREGKWDRTDIIFNPEEGSLDRETLITWEYSDEDVPPMLGIHTQITWKLYEWTLMLLAKPI